MQYITTHVGTNVQPFLNLRNLRPRQLSLRINIGLRGIMPLHRGA